MEDNDRAKIIFDKMPLGCHLWDSNITIIDCNEAALKLYGFKDKQEQIDKFHARSPEYQPDGQSSERKSHWLIKKAFAEGGYSAEWMHQAQDGSPIPVELTLTRLRFGGEDVVAAYTRDLRDIKKLEGNINSLKATEAALLREANDHMKLMLDATPLGCHLWSSSLEIIDCNKASIKLYGFNSRQEQLDNFDASSPEYQPDGQLSKQKALNLLRKAFAEGYCESDWMHRTPDGALIPVELTFVRIQYRNDHVVAVYARDLRDIRKMEANILRLETEVDKIYYDPLTGIYNRRFFDEGMKHVLAALARSNGMLGFLMIDIDYFKKYNDAYGHSEGDVCLKAVAQALQKSISRGDDFVARYGGEEFAVVLPNTDESGACGIANRLLESVRGCGLAHRASDAAECVTLSIGVTTGMAGCGHSVKDYIERADEMLYKSKQAGRNRYTFGSLACSFNSTQCRPVLPPRG